MGQFKDAVFLEIWRHLKTSRSYSAHLSTLNSPAGKGDRVRSTWNELQNNLREERLKKGTGMKVVIAERPDLFVLSSTDTGHPVVTLTPAAQATDPETNGLALLPHLAMDMPDVEAAPPAAGEDAAMADQLAAAAAAAEKQLLEGMVKPAAGAAAQAYPAKAAPGPTGASASLKPALAPGAITREMLEQQQAAAAAAQAAAFSSPGGTKQTTAQKEKKKQAQPTGTFISACEPGPIWAKYGYMDLIWTPKVAAAKEREKRKEWAIVRALYEAIDSYDGEVVTISQMGVDFKVAQLKKDPQFSSIKLVDILKRYDEVFEVVVDGGRGFVARLLPSAQVALPDAEEALARAVTEAELMMPEKIKNPTNIKDRMQALRIEVIHALHRRGGMATEEDPGGGKFVPVQELGQEHRIQKYKANIAQAKKLIDFLKIFPVNFGLTLDEAGQAQCCLLCCDVDDTSMIDLSIQRTSASFSQPTSTVSAFSAARNSRTSTDNRRAPYTPGAQRSIQSPALPLAMGGAALPVGQFAVPGMMPPVMMPGTMPGMVPGMTVPMAGSLAAMLQPQSMTGFSDPNRL